MATSDLINISGLMDDAKCFAFVRERRWPDGVRCPGCDSEAVIRDGCDNTQHCRQRYRCKACGSRFDDLTGTVLAGAHHGTPSRDGSPVAPEHHHHMARAIRALLFLSRPHKAFAR